MLGEDQPRLLIAATDGVASAGSEVAITGAGDLPDGEGGAVLDAADAQVEPGDRAELLQSAEDASRSSGRAAGAGVRTERFCREGQTLQVPSGDQQELLEVDGESRLEA